MQIPVLMYHEIVSGTPSTALLDRIQGSYLVSSETFEKQMAYLKQERYTSVSPLGAVDILKTGKKVNIKPIVITFDDGYEGNYLNALPILKQYGLSATFFVTAGFVGRECMLTWDQIREMNHEKMSIGSHCLSHPVLTSLTKVDIKNEMLDSKSILEKKIGVKVDSFSFPNGVYSSEILEITKNSGYKTACSSDFGLNNKNVDAFRIKRLKVPKSFDLSDFGKLLSYEWKMHALFKTKFFVLSMVKKLIGPDYYERLYSKIFNIKD